MFRPLQPTQARWRSVEGDGLEHLTIGPAKVGPRSIIRVDSVVIGSRGGKPYGMRYGIDCSPQWAVLSFSIETTDGRALALRSDGNGHWRQADGSALPEFDGCIDIDLAGTPFTNSLPIRRLDLTPSAGPASLDMLYVPFDDFAPRRDAQRYRCQEEGRLYRYEAEDRSLTVDLPVDSDGLVIDYPGLFERAAL